MGLASLLLGKENPFSQFVDSRQNTLGAWGAGLASGPSFQQGLSNAVQYGAQAAPLDQQAAEQRRAEEAAKAQMNRTAEYLRSVPGGAPFADAIDKGGVDASTAFKGWFEFSRPKQPDYTTDQQNFMFAQQNPDFASFLNPAKEPDYPTSYDEFKLAQENPEYAAQLAAGKGAPTVTDADVRAEKLASVVQGDKALLLGDGTNKGIYDALADPWSQVVGADVGVGGVGIGKPGYALTSADFQSAQNAMTNIAQSYLYAISGQAAPAGEVAKIVQSVTPVLGENKTSVENKKKRLAAYIAAIETSKRDVQGGGMGGGGEWTVLGVE